MILLNDDDFGFEMSTLEQRWPVLSHERPSLSDPLRRFATLPLRRFSMPKPAGIGCMVIDNCPC
jgi:hypothetical protein